MDTSNWPMVLMNRIAHYGYWLIIVQRTEEPITAVISILPVYIYAACGCLFAYARWEC